jgi:hypothetical protein
MNVPLAPKFPRNSRLNDAFIELHYAFVIQNNCHIAAFGSYAVELLCEKSLAEEIEIIAEGDKEGLLNCIDEAQCWQTFRLFGTILPWRITLLHQHGILIHIYPMKVEGEFCPRR